MEFVCCDLCGADDARPIYAGETWRHLVPAGLRLVRCQRCGLLYLNPRPGPDEIGVFYPTDYAAYRGAIEDERFGLMRWMRRSKLVKRRRLIERYSGLSGGRVLDVGCATGLFLHEMALAGWQPTGVDLSGTAAEYARTRFGLEVFQGQLADAGLPHETFDVITYWDVLEHTFSPSTELRQAAALLKPGGIVAVNVPKWRSFDRALFGPYWAGLDPPRHLYVFTEETLTALLSEAGLEPLAWVSFMPGYFSFLYSLDCWLTTVAPGIARPVSGLLGIPGVRLVFEPWFALLNLLGLANGVTVFARKRG